MESDCLPLELRDLVSISSGGVMVVRKIILRLGVTAEHPDFALTLLQSRVVDSIHNTLERHCLLEIHYFF